MLSTRRPAHRHFQKISTIGFRKGAWPSRKEISHALRASNPPRFGGGPPHHGRADAREKLQHAFSPAENSRSAGINQLPCLPAGGRWFVDATALSGDGF